jgi:small GTP-binding protein
MSEGPDSNSNFDRWQQELRGIWDSLPSERQSELNRILDQLPGDARGWKGLIDRATNQLLYAVGDSKQVVIVGPANVGKSTLYNRLIRSKHDRAEVSALPGTTRRSQTADAGLFAVIDTPGADAVGAVGEEEKQRAFSSAEEADFLVVMYDASHGIRNPEHLLFRDLLLLEKPMIVVLNKMDLISRNEQSAVRGKAAASLGLQSDQLIPLSAKRGRGIEDVLLAIVRAEPRLVAALGAALPEYRISLIRPVVIGAASTAAAIAITPFPFLDFFPLLGIQVAMMVAISRIYGYKITPARAKELIATFGVAVLGRTLFYEVTRLGGPPAWLVSAAVAAGTTVALGYAGAIWFEQGDAVSADTLKQIARTVSDTLIDRLRDLGRRRPKRETLEQSIRQALEEIADEDDPLHAGQEPDEPQGLERTEQD